MTKATWIKLMQRGKYPMKKTEDDPWDSVTR